MMGRSDDFEELAFPDFQEGSFEAQAALLMSLQAVQTTALHKLGIAGRALQAIDRFYMAEGDTTDQHGRKILYPYASVTDEYAIQPVVFVEALDESKLEFGVCFRGYHKIQGPGIGTPFKRSSPLGEIVGGQMRANTQDGLYEDGDAIEVFSLAQSVQLAREFGALPDLSADCTEIIEPPAVNDGYIDVTSL